LSGLLHGERRDQRTPVTGERNGVIRYLGTREVQQVFCLDAVHQHLHLIITPFPVVLIGQDFPVLDAGGGNLLTEYHVLPISASSRDSAIAPSISGCLSFTSSAINP